MATCRECHECTTCTFLTRCGGEVVLGSSVVVTILGTSPAGVLGLHYSLHCRQYSPTARYFGTGCVVSPVAQVASYDVSPWPGGRRTRGGCCRSPPPTGPALRPTGRTINCHAQTNKHTNQQTNEQSPGCSRAGRGYEGWGTAAPAPAPRPPATTTPGRHATFSRFPQVPAQCTIQHTPHVNMFRGHKRHRGHRKHKDKCESGGAAAGGGGGGEEGVGGEEEVSLCDQSCLRCQWFTSRCLHI